MATKILKIQRKSIFLENMITEIRDCWRNRQLTGDILYDLYLGLGLIVHDNGIVEEIFSQASQP